MKLELWRVSRATPLARDARRGWPERSSVRLRLEAADGAVGQGEASPLPGYSPDSLEQAEAALAAVDHDALSAALAEPECRQALARIGELAAPSAPSARMALETAALDLLGQRRHGSAPALLGALAGATRALCWLLGPALEPDVTERAQQAYAQGYRCFKLKLGVPERAAAEAAALLRLRAELGDAVELRADANRALSRADAEALCRALEPARLELFEEPAVSLVPALSTSLPLALDESLQAVREDAELAGLLAASGARFVVLKPMVLGGLARCWRLAEHARALGAGVVLSHAFDGALALRATAAPALALAPGAAHGLAPHAGLGNPARRALPLVEGRGALRFWQESGLGLHDEARP